MPFRLVDHRAESAALRRNPARSLTAPFQNRMRFPSPRTAFAAAAIALLLTGCGVVCGGAGGSGSGSGFAGGCATGMRF
ncbi:hypothetical protein P3T18_004551 [Paraburkholderia sp. GAS199]